MSIAEIKQEIKIQKNLLFTLDNEIITSYEKVLVDFFRNLKKIQYNTRKNKLQEFLKVVPSSHFVKILGIIQKIQIFSYVCLCKKNSLMELRKNISEAKVGLEQCANALLKIWKKIRKDKDFPKNLDLWEPKIKNLLQVFYNTASDIYALDKDCETKDLIFNAQTENVKLQEYEDFLNNSTSYTRKDSGLFVVNLYQFFINNYGRPYWLWIAEFLNCLFDRAETESSMRNNLKNQLQQTVVFLPHIGLYYLKKKDKKETL